MVFNFSKKDPTTTHALKTKLSLKVSEIYQTKKCVFGITLLQSFRSIVYNLLLYSKFRVAV